MSAQANGDKQRLDSGTLAAELNQLHTKHLQTNQINLLFPQYDHYIFQLVT